MARLKFLLSLLVEENPYQKLQAATAQEAAHHLGVDVQILFANNDALTQCEQLLHFIQSPSQLSRPDGIICAPVGTALEQVAHQAVSHGIGWAVLNRDADYIAGLRQSCHVPVFTVSADQQMIGQIQAQQMAILLPEGGLALYIVGPTGNPLAEKRFAGMMSAKPGNIDVKTLTGDWSEPSGYRAVKRWLQLRPSHASPVSLVVAQNDSMAIGARRALEEKARGCEQGHSLNLPYVGCGCCPGAGREWVRQGRLISSVINPPTAGMALHIMVRAMQTKLLPPEHTTVSPASHPELEMLGKKSALNLWVEHIQAQEFTLCESSQQFTSHEH